jgi:predicted nucleotidyltransferase
MPDPMLSEKELALMHEVFRAHPTIEQVVLFGSRAKGNARPASDVDLAIFGSLDDLQIETLTLDLDELPLPYKFDVISVETIRHPPFREHIDRVGIILFNRQETSQSP